MSIILVHLLSVTITIRRTRYGGDILDNIEERPYSSKEMCTTLDLGSSTLRKWCLALEKHGYHFIRNDQNQRLFTHHDIVSLKHYKTMVQDNNFSLDNAAVVISSKFNKDALSNETQLERVNPEENMSSDERSLVQFFEGFNSYTKTLEEHIKQQEQFNQALLERLDQQQKYIEERLSKRDETLVQSLREVQATRKLIAAAAEEEQKKSFFSRLFGK